ncbi:Surfactin synthase thioesterase subunit [Marininema mesophilum]|uniref:Surfactin synthase thioesterase subunit n=1 Tax=Marininema mesophilum TaxID=1048340 RepID=A0A1H3B1R3_9BACL|nr:alpha/beta fold hydrolase [Marininema mesophilum]SDX35853.1 Surfactin synthase thioesterase subunit [Marininema mesophilum]
MTKQVLFCFPYAGGAASVYAKWRKHLLHGIECYPVEYAGRGKRWSEPFYQQMDDATEDLFHQLKHTIGSANYSFFGHSMGGLIAYELCKKVIREGYQPPAHLYLSGVKAPDQPRDRSIHHLPDDAFKKEIQELKGTPQEVLDNQDLFSIFSPILRADFRLVEEYRFIKEESKVPSPIIGLYGEEDDVDEEAIKKWREYTTSHFHVWGYPGGHFFINDHYEELARTISEEIGHRNDRVGHR